MPRQRGSRGRGRARKIRKRSDSQEEALSKEQPKKLRKPRNSSISRVKLDEVLDEDQCRSLGVSARSKRGRRRGSRRGARRGYRNTGNRSSVFQMEEMDSKSFRPLFESRTLEEDLEHLRTWADLDYAKFKLIKVDKLSYNKLQEDRFPAKDEVAVLVTKVFPILVGKIYERIKEKGREFYILGPNGIGKSYFLAWLVYELRQISSCRVIYYNNPKELIDNPFEYILHEIKIAFKNDKVDIPYTTFKNLDKQIEFWDILNTFMLKIDAFIKTKNLKLICIFDQENLLHNDKTIKGKHSIIIEQIENYLLEYQSRYNLLIRSISDDNHQKFSYNYYFEHHKHETFYFSNPFDIIEGIIYIKKYWSEYNLHQKIPISFPHNIDTIDKSLNDADSNLKHIIDIVGLYPNELYKFINYGKRENLKNLDELKRYYIEERYSELKLLHNKYINNKLFNISHDTKLKYTILTTNLDLEINPIKNLWYEYDRDLIWYDDRKQCFKSTCHSAYKIIQEYCLTNHNDNYILPNHMLEWEKIFRIILSNIANQESIKNSKVIQDFLSKYFLYQICLYPDKKIDNKKNMTTLKCYHLGDKLDKPSKIWDCTFTQIIYFDDIKEQFNIHISESFQISKLLIPKIYPYFLGDCFILYKENLWIIHTAHKIKETKVADNSKIYPDNHILECLNLNSTDCCYDFCKALKTIGLKFKTQFVWVTSTLFLKEDDKKNHCCMMNPNSLWIDLPIHINYN